MQARQTIIPGRARGGCRGAPPTVGAVPPAGSGAAILPLDLPPVRRLGRMARHAAHLQSRQGVLRIVGGPADPRLRDGGETAVAMILSGWLAGLPTDPAARAVLGWFVSGRNLDLHWRQGGPGVEEAGMTRVDRLTAETYGAQIYEETGLCSYFAELRLPAPLWQGRPL